MLLYAERFKGAHSAVRALTKGLFAHGGLLPHGGNDARLEGSSASLEGHQQHEQSTQCGSSSPSQGAPADPHACSHKSAHHSGRSGVELVRPLNSVRWRHQHHSSPALGGVKGLSDPVSSRRSNTFASYSCTPELFTPHHPPLNQIDNVRSFSNGSSHSLVAEANSILRTVDIMGFRERLERESETTQRLTMPELITMCKESGAAQSDEEAARVCEALAHAGIVLRFGGCVFLRPQDVVEIMMRSVPDLEEEVVARLKELESEMQPLAEQQRKIEARAYRRTHGVLWAGLGFLVLQWGIFLHFTYSELSWDVVEPVTYFTSQLWAILGYCYFLATKEDFAYRHAHSKMSQNFTVGGERDHGFDRERYERLRREHSRYQRYLRLPAAEGQ